MDGVRGLVELLVCVQDEKVGHNVVRERVEDTV